MTIYNLCVPIVLLHFCLIIGKVVSSVVTRKVAKTTDVPSGIYFFKSILRQVKDWITQLLLMLYIPVPYTHT